MRLLLFHVDSFTCTVTEKGRSSLIETPTAPSTHIDEGLLVLASAESTDATHGEAVAQAASDEITRIAAQLKADEIVVLPFAHLFADPCPAEAALAMIDATAAHLVARGLRVQRPPFGWFHTWDLKAKGHPMSRVARTIRAPEGPAE